jgi:hypothetical protein
VAFTRLGWFRSLVTASLIAVPVFAVGFLASGPIRPLLATEAAGGEVLSRNDSPVVFMVFDEMGLGTLLTPDGEINGALFPNIERLAGTSTWYSEATTVAPWTYLAMPALLAGRIPEEFMLPSGVVWPRNVLALSGDDGEVITFEWVTALCPADNCRRVDGAGGDLWRDSFAVLVNALLPPGMAGRLSPPLGDRWAGFGGEDQDPASAGEQVERVSNDQQVGEFQDIARAEVVARLGNIGPVEAARLFVESLSGLGRSDIAFLHSSLPHLPEFFVADGTRYDRGTSSWVEIETGADPAGGVGLRQRVLLQTMFVDQLVGEVLDELERVGILDDALVVLASDHGMSFQASSHRRARNPDATQETIDEVLPVPLFIKAPGQTAGARDDRDVRIIDVLPTMLDLLNVDLAEPWELDGRSLLGELPGDRPRWFVGIGEFSLRPSALAAAQRQWAILGPRALAGQMYAIGPYADLVGRPLEDPVVAGVLGAPQTAVGDKWADVDPASGFLPLLVSVTNPEGVASGDWVVAALNGVIAGVGPVFVSRDDVLLAEVMVDPSAVVPGANDLAVFAVTGR